MQTIINNILTKDYLHLTFKERQLVIDYFRFLVNKEFEDFKKGILKKEKTEIFEKSYLIETYDNIRTRLIGLSFFTIAKLLKYQKNGFIDYMYNADVNDGIFDYYDSIESKIIKEIPRIKQQNEKKIA